MCTHHERRLFFSLQRPRRGRRESRTPWTPGTLLPTALATLGLLLRLFGSLLLVLLGLSGSGLLLLLLVVRLDSLQGGGRVLFLLLRAPLLATSRLAVVLALALQLLG